MESVHVEQLTLDGVGIGLEASVGAEAGAGGPSQLAADSLLLSDDVPDALGNELMVALVGEAAPGCRACTRRRRGFQAATR